MDSERILAGLDPEQRQVAQSVAGPVVVLAGAGTGKTRAVTHRIAYAVQTGTMDPRRTLVVTFTTRAAGEFSRRLRAMGVDGVRVRTVHAESLRQLKWMWPQVVGGPMPKLMSSKIGLVSTALSRIGAPTDDAMRRDVTSAIERAKACGLGPEDGEALVGPDTPMPELFADVYRAYEDVKAAAGAVDFEDILLLNAGLLDQNVAVAEQVRQWCRWITVDEYQDVSALQQRVLEGWLGDRDEVCVVGDPAQTIYSFAGARADYLLEFPRRWPGAKALSLTRSYRCTPQIIAEANRVLAGDRREALTLRSQRPPGGPVVTTAYEDELAEADGVATQIQDLLGRGVPPAEIAILVRINAATARFERALQARGIPFNVRGTARFMQRPEVKKAVSLLRVAARFPVAGLASLPEQVQAVLEPMGYTATPPVGQAQREEWESVSALVALARSLPEGSGMPELVADLDERVESDDAPVADAVTLASLHSAKGLEWQAVFLVGLYEGGLPLRYQGQFADVDEERRLFYVGLTRAKDVLHLSYPQTGSRSERRKPSRFLAGARTQVTVRGTQRDADAPRGAVCDVCGKRLTNAVERTLGRCGSCPSDIDPALVSDLRQWRSDAVAVERERTGRKIPAFVVATDAVLLTIARDRPTSLGALSEVRGISRRVVAERGDQVLRIVQRHTSGL